MTSAPTAVLTCFGLLASCEATRLESAVGQHVVVHWDSDENRLCGGTLRHIDSSLEVVAQTYGLDLPTEPNIDILWTEDRTLLDSACRTVGCDWPLPNGTHVLLTKNIVDLHELTHTVNLTGKNLVLPSFFQEGVAVRWENGLGTWAQSDKALYAGDVSHSEILALLDRWQIPADHYETAGFLWAWLEAEFGPHTMQEFASRIDVFSSPKKVEREFEATFGITLKMATDASRGQPLFIFDPHACSMPDLPTLVWAEEPLVLSPGPSTCAANDVVNSDNIAARYVRLDLPEPLRQYTLELDGPTSGAAIHFFACLGEPRPYEDPIVLIPSGGERQQWLAGTYVVIATAPLEEDGRVPFPTAKLKPVSPSPSPASRVGHLGQVVRTLPVARVE